MKNNVKILLASALIGTTALTATAFADRGDGDRQERMIERVSERLELDDTQTQALSGFLAEMTETRELMRGDGEGLRSEFGALIGDDSFDQGQALALINERTAAVQANAPELVAAAAVFFDGLSAEQKAQVQEMLEKGGRGHRGMGPRR